MSEQYQKQKKKWFNAGKQEATQQFREIIEGVYDKEIGKDFSPEQLLSIAHFCSKLLSQLDNHSQQPTQHGEELVVTSDGPSSAHGSSADTFKGNKAEQMAHKTSTSP